LPILTLPRIIILYIKKKREKRERERERERDKIIKISLQNQHHVIIKITLNVIFMTEICVALSIICLSCITERAESYTRISEAPISLDKF